MMSKLKKAGLNGCFDGTGVTSTNYKEIMSEKPSIQKMQNETINFDILYYNLIGYLGLEKTKEFLDDYYNLKEEVERIEKGKKS